MTRWYSDIGVELQLPTPHPIIQNMNRGIMGHKPIKRLKGSRLCGLVWLVFAARASHSRALNSCLRGVHNNRNRAATNDFFFYYYHLLISQYTIEENYFLVKRTVSKSNTIHIYPIISIIIFSLKRSDQNISYTKSHALPFCVHVVCHHTVTCL